MTRQQFLQNVNPYCHCEALRPRQSISSESGRSLVEMLGTLAVMGVLTIGGIAGFNYAMNKQRANATINYVNQVAVLGTGQMLAGNKPKLLDYPKQTPSGYVADITTDDDKPNAFYVEINGVPAAVCEEITARQAGWSMVNDIGFFDGDSGCSDKETADMWFEITGNADKKKGDGVDSIDTGVCSNGNVYLSYAEEGHECDVEAPSDMGCKKNSDCVSGEYCKLDGGYRMGCVIPQKGECAALGTGIEKNYIHDGKSKKLLLFGEERFMSWWAAENWCKAQHMKLVKHSTLGCTYSECPDEVYSDMNSIGLDNRYWMAWNPRRSPDACTGITDYIGVSLKTLVDRELSGGCYALCE